MFRWQFCAIFALFSVIRADQPLEKLTSCSCVLPNSTKVDLAPLAGSGGKPRFLDLYDQSATSTWQYSYNPCTPFTQTSTGEEGSLCRNVAVCQHSQTDYAVQLFYFNLGTQDSVKFALQSHPTTRSVLSGLTSTSSDVINRLMADPNDHVVFTYSDKLENPDRTSQVILTCSKAQTFVVVGESPNANPTQFVFELGDPTACPVPYTRPPGSGGISLGAILCILLFVGIVFYIAIGIVFMKYVKHADGTDLVPNKTFWVAIPGYIKDGCTFTYSVVTRKPVDNYQKI